MGDVPDLTIKILQPIRDEIRETRKELSDRIDQTNTRLDSHERLLVRLAENSVVHERLLVRLADDSALHTQALRQLIERVDGTNARIDDVLRGPLGGAVRDPSERLDVLEEDVATLKRRTG